MMQFTTKDGVSVEVVFHGTANKEVFNSEILHSAQKQKRALLVSRLADGSRSNPVGLRVL